MAKDGRKQRLAIAVALYVVVVGVFFAVVPKSRILEHTPFNHFALLADSWLHRRLSLGGVPPAYAQNNDFASYDGRWFIVFPPFPAVLLVPFVWWAKSVEKVRDGQLFIWISGIGPAVFFLALEKLRLTGRSGRTQFTNVVLTLLLAFGTVYFFTAVQGTVWFVAHVVGVAIAALYLLCALDAEHPALSGLLLGLGFLTRTPLLFAFPLFLLEAARVTSTGPAPDRVRFLKLVVRFALPLVACFALALVYNKARFGKPLDFGYQYLTVAWQARMKRWGLFNYHFLGRNLGVVLTGLPFWDGKAKVPLTINQHGLALWVTTPLFLYLLWPKKLSDVAIALYVTAAAVAIPGLFYQNTGWMQFGYRFSNDYAVFLVALLAVTGHEFRKLFAFGLLWSIAVNAFGAVTFDHGDYRKFYFDDPSQRTFYQPD